MAVIEGPQETPGENGPACECYADVCSRPKARQDLRLSGGIRAGERLEGQDLQLAIAARGGLTVPVDQRVELGKPARHGRDSRDVAH